MAGSTLPLASPQNLSNLARSIRNVVETSRQNSDHFRFIWQCSTPDRSAETVRCRHEAIACQVVKHRSARRSLPVMRAEYLWFGFGLDWRKGRRVRCIWRGFATRQAGPVAALLSDLDGASN